MVVSDLMKRTGFEQWLPRGQTEPWLLRGMWVGLGGSALVAILFLLLDLATGRPFWTPTALGSALFFNEAVTSQAAPRPGVILGYTLIHGAVFLAAAVIASFLIHGRERIWWKGLVWCTAAIFAALELTFLAVGALAAPLLLGTIGLPWLTVANFLAAATMAWIVSRPRTEIGRE